jgi:hypothetical protein
MSKELYEKGQWMVDRDIKWNINSIGRKENPIWGACPEVMVKIGNIVEHINVFVFKNPPYPLILRVPFITKLRVQTMVLDDEMHMAKVKSKDSYRHLQFRDCHELRTLRELEEQNLKDFD